MQNSLASALQKNQGLEAELWRVKADYQRMLDQNFWLAGRLESSDHSIAVLHMHVRYIEQDKAGLEMSLAAAGNTMAWYEQQAEGHLVAATDETKRLKGTIQLLQNAVSLNRAKKAMKRRNAKANANAKMRKAADELATLECQLGQGRGKQQAAKTIMADLSTQKNSLQSELQKIKNASNKQAGKEGRQANAREQEVSRLESALKLKDREIQEHEKLMLNIGKTIDSDQQERQQLQNTVEKATQDLKPNYSLTLFGARDEDTGSIGTLGEDFSHELRHRLAELEAKVAQEQARADAVEAHLRNQIAGLERSAAQLRGRNMANFVDVIELLRRGRLELSAHVLAAVAGRLDEVVVGTVPSKANAAVEEVNMYLFEVRAQGVALLELTVEDWSNVSNMIGDIQRLLPPPVPNTGGEADVNRICGGIKTLRGDVVKLLSGLEHELGKSAAGAMATRPKARPGPLAFLKPDEFIYAGALKLKRPGSLALAQPPTLRSPTLAPADMSDCIVAVIFCCLSDLLLVEDGCRGFRALWANFMKVYLCMRVLPVVKSLCLDGGSARQLRR
jgi:hypothetical protein